MFKTGSVTTSANSERSLSTLARTESIRCNLDITLLTPEEDRFVFTAGDIDRQLKALFDALRLPIHADFIGAPSRGECPLFCLLEEV